MFMLIALSSLVSTGQVRIEVDCSDVIAQRNEPMRYGACMNYLIDSDNYDPKRKIKIRESLRNLKVKAIRWNEVMRRKLELKRLDHLIAHQYGYKDTLNLESAVKFLVSLPAPDRKI